MAKLKKKNVCIDGAVASQSEDRKDSLEVWKNTHDHQPIGEHTDNQSSDAEQRTVSIIHCVRK